MTHPKLREAVARAIDWYERNYGHIQFKDRLTDHILSLPEIADALKREEKNDTEILDWMQAHQVDVEVSDNETLTCRVSTSDDFEVRAMSDPYNIRAACRAAMSGGEKLDGKDTPQGGK